MVYGSPDDDWDNGDDNNDVGENDNEEEESNDEDNQVDLSDEIAALESEVDIGDVAQLSEMAEEMNDNVNTEEPQHKVLPTVQLKDLGGTVFKSTLVELLNEDSKLSKDRLMRVRQSGSKSSNVTSNSDTKYHLFDDIVIVDIANQEYEVSRIVRLQKKGKKRGSFEIRGYVCGDEISEIMFHLKKYEKSGEKFYSSTDILFSYDGSCQEKAGGKRILCSVNLEYAVDENKYRLVDNIEAEINKLFAAACPTSSRSSSARRSQPVVERQTMSDDGRRTTVINPSEELPEDSNLRRSSRKRVQRWYLT